MHDSEEHVKCPCDKCLLLILCRNKPIEVLLKECELLYKYMVSSSNSAHTRLNMDRFYEFCKPMKISANQYGHNIRITYTGRKVKK